MTQTHSRRHVLRGLIAALSLTLLLNAMSPGAAAVPSQFQPLAKSLHRHPATICSVIPHRVNVFVWASHAKKWSNGELPMRVFTLKWSLDAGGTGGGSENHREFSHRSGDALLLNKPSAFDCFQQPGLARATNLADRHDNMNTRRIPEPAERALARLERCRAAWTMLTDAVREGQS